MTLQVTDLSVEPFFDDYDPDKNFHRILFRPRSVQARELNQVQSILQDQLSRLGRHLFEEGSVVIPGGINTKVDQDTVKIDFSGAITEEAMNDYMPDLYIKSKLGTVEAKVIHYSPAIGIIAPALAIEYTKTAVDGVTKTFAVNEVCVFILRLPTGDVEISNVNVLGSYKGLFVSVLTGAYFVHGHYVITGKQNILAEPFDNTVAKTVGFTVVEEIVDETKDASLFSNAIGEPNWKAPGAARLKITLKLAAKDTLATPLPDPSFVELVKFQDGLLQKKIDQANYAVIDRALAQRTYETNGDYVVGGYNINLYQHLRDSLRPDGIYPAVRGGDANKFVVRLGEGVGYVQGYRGAITGFEDIAVDKALDTTIVNNGVMYAEFGSYIIVNNMNSVPPLDIKERINLMAIDGSTVVGTCVIRSMKRESATSLRLYIMDIVMGGSYTYSNDAKKVKYTNATNLFTADIIGNSIYGSSKDSFVFPFPYNTVKSVVGTAGVDTSYSVVRTYDVTVNASGIGSVTVPSGETFAAINSFDYVAGITSSTGGIQFDVNTILSVGGSPVGRTLNVNVTAAQPNKVIRVVASVLKSNPTPKVKTLYTQTDVLNFAGVARMKLSKADVYDITTIINSANNADEKANFAFNDGQRPNWYESGEVYTKSGALLTGTWTVTYRYFGHTNGDYFNVDSYGGMARELIPMTTSTASRTRISLADVMDYRPLKDASGVFTSMTFAGDIVDPSDSVRFDLTYYLNRRDIVYQTPDGDYLVKKGIPADNPLIPSTPANCMKLYDMFVPAYTSSVGSIVYQRTDNKRYTMRDIGKLENRIGTLEYYTSLSLLEQKVDKAQIIDPTTGNARFKNGFTADNFTDLGLSDVADPQWSACISEVDSILVAGFTQNPQDLSVATSTNAAINDLVSKSFTDVLYASQTLATTTTNINPYAVFAWAGSVKLNPASDFWSDTVYMPPNVVRQPDVSKSVLNFGYDGVNPIPPAGAPAIWAGAWRLNRIISSTNIWGTGNDGRQVGEIELLEWMATGETKSSTTTQTWNTDSLISTSIVPWMRSRDIAIDMQGLRPFTKMHFFFGGINVDAFCKPTGGSYGGDFITDSSGKITGTFTIPSTPTARFAVGTTSFRTTDSVTDDRVNLTTFAETSFYSMGTTENRQVTQNVQDTQSTSNEWGWVQTKVSRFDEPISKVAPVDPIAQTFFVSEQKGIFVSKIAVAFSTKAASVPVTLEIRNVRTGLPDTSQVPFGRALLYPASITTSEDGTVFTNFVFNDPVYLPGNDQYAIVLLADTQEYNVFKAVMGENVIGQQVSVAKQPNVGVFFSSSNSTTWTAHQLEDLTFKIFKAQFSLTDTTVEFNGSVPVVTASVFNPMSTVTGTNVITCRVRSHGLKNGDSTTISAFVTANGIPAGDINGTHVVSNVTIDTFTFTTATNATLTGTMGGNDVRFLVNYPFTEFIPSISQKTLQGTTIRWEFQYLIQGSRSRTAWLPFTNNAKFTFLIDEGVVLNAATDFKVRCTMTTTDANVTPQIDLSGAGCMMMGARINNDVNNPAYRYVTKSVRFDNPSTSARIWPNVSLPGNSTMRVYYKLLTTGDEVLNTKPWIELMPVKPLANNVAAIEYEYQLANVGSFIGYKMSVVFLGDDACQTPIMSDFRTASLA